MNIKKFMDKVRGKDTNINVKRCFNPTSTHVFKGKRSLGVMHAGTIAAYLEKNPLVALYILREITETKFKSIREDVNTLDELVWEKYNE